MNSVLLTIDDVPSLNTPAMVDYFNEKGIKPILFAAGQNVERYYDQALYAVKQGMIVGNHSYSHLAFSTLTPEACIRDIEKCEQLLDHLYCDAGIERRYRPFRFPYGDKGGANKEIIQKYLKENGFHKVDDRHIPYKWWREGSMHTDLDTFWTFDFEEYKVYLEKDFTVENVWAKINDPHPQYGAALFHPEHRHIALMHAHDETEAIIPAYYRLFIDHLLEQGITFDEPHFLTME